MELQKPQQLRPPHELNGKAFGIAHPIVIGEMVALAKSKLQDELTKIEKQIIAVFA